MARSEVNYIYDADTAFRAPGSAAVTADTVVSLSLDKMVNLRPSDQRNKLGAEAYDVVIVVESVDTADADETYVFNVRVGAVGSGAAGILAGATAVAGPGQYVIKVDAQTIEKLSTAREVITLQTDVGGTTPAIVYSAWYALGRGH